MCSRQDSHKTRLKTREDNKELGMTLRQRAPNARLRTIVDAALDPGSSPG